MQRESKSSNSILEEMSAGSKDLLDAQEPSQADPSTSRAGTDDMRRSYEPRLASPRRGRPGGRDEAIANHDHCTSIKSEP